MATFNLSNIPIYKNKCKKCHHFIARHCNGNCTITGCLCVVNYSRKFDTEEIFRRFIEILSTYPGPLSIYDLEELYGSDIPEHILHQFRQAVLTEKYVGILTAIKIKPLLIIHNSNINLDTSKDYISKPWWNQLDDAETVWLYH